MLLLRPPLLTFFVFVRFVIACNRYLYAYLSCPRFLTVLELVRELLGAWSRTIRALFLVNDLVVDRGMKVRSLRRSAWHGYQWCVRNIINTDNNYYCTYSKIMIQIQSYSIFVCTCRPFQMVKILTKIFLDAE